MATTFKQTIARDPSTLMIVDALNLAFRYKHAKQLDFLEDYMKTVDSLARSYKAGKVVLACDSGSSWFRKEILPEYKEHRKEKFEEQSDEEKEFFILFFEEFNRVMESYAESDIYPLFRFKKTEADDIAAYLVKHRKKFDINKVWLISSDRDWDLLVDSDVSRFSYVTRKEVTEENWDTHYDFTRDQYISIKCLQGDSGDNVPGVDKIGPKTALKLLDQYGTAYDVAANLPINSKYVYIQNLNKFGMDNILRNYKLMDLIEFCEDAIGPENCKIIESRMMEYK